MDILDTYTDEEIAEREALLERDLLVGREPRTS
jgi:hypothetical protein